MSTQPSIFIDVNDGDGPNPVARAIKAVAFGGRIVEKLVDEGDVEADIAVTNSVATALRIVNETERTVIMLIYFRSDERNQAVAFASRFSQRVEVVSGIGGDGQIAFVPRLLQLIAKKTMGGENENPSD